MIGKTLRTDVDEGVFAITLTRAAEYNTITPELRAEGPALCAGYGLDWSTAAQSGELARTRERVWDSVADMRMMGRFVATYMKLWYAAKPTIAAVQGWCVGGGTDMVLCADQIIAADDASFGYPPARVWGTPTTAMWVYRMR